MTTSLNFSYFIRYLLTLLKSLVSEKSTNDSKVISYVLRGHINPSWHLKMCSKLSAFLLQKGQKVLPSYFSVKFVLMSGSGFIFKAAVFNCPVHLRKYFSSPVLCVSPFVLVVQVINYMALRAITDQFYK